MDGCCSSISREFLWCMLTPKTWPHPSSTPAHEGKKKKKKKFKFLSDLKICTYLIAQIFQYFWHQIWYHCRYFLHWGQLGNQNLNEKSSMLLSYYYNAKLWEVFNMTLIWLQCGITNILPFCFVFAFFSPLPPSWK